MVTIFFKKKKKILFLYYLLKEATQPKLKYIISLYDLLIIIIKETKLKEDVLFSQNNYHYYKSLSS
jgi:hypothetical protein